MKTTSLSLLCAMPNRWVLCLLFGLACAVTVVAQTPAEKTKRDEGARTARSNKEVDDSRPASVLVTPDEDYRIGLNDVLDIQIEDAPELSGNRRVSAAGSFLMPYLGRVTAKGKTIEELAKTIADGLRDKYLFDPQVTVNVKQFNSRSYFIHGSVRSPGVYQIEGRPSLIELLTVAGGLNPDHGSTAFVIRRIKPTDSTAKNHDETKAVTASLDQTENVDPTQTAEQSNAQPETENAEPTPQYTMLKVNINGLLKGRFEQNLQIEAGDIVNIPISEVFFVAGEVKGPGSFPLKEGTTLRQAISLAQGITFKAAANRGIIFREHPETGKRQEIPIDISAIMSGKAEDQPIYANDVVIVPNSRMKSIAAPVLSAFGVSAARIPFPY
jgi:polysaccharide export outer membrane protein